MAGFIDRILQAYTGGIVGGGKQPDDAGQGAFQSVTGDYGSSVPETGSGTSTIPLTAPLAIPQQGQANPLVSGGTTSNLFGQNQQSQFVPGQGDYNSANYGAARASQAYSDSSGSQPSSPPVFSNLNYGGGIRGVATSLVSNYLNKLINSSSSASPNNMENSSGDSSGGDD